MEEACSNGNLELVKQHIKDGADPTQADEVSTVKSHDLKHLIAYIFSGALL